MRPRARAVLAYGQSGDPRSPHFSDQTELFARQAWREVLFSEQEIASDKALRTKIVTGPRAKSQFPVTVERPTLASAFFVARDERRGCQGRIAGARTGCPGVTPSTVRPFVTTATPLTST